MISDSSAKLSDMNKIITVHGPTDERKL